MIHPTPTTELEDQQDSILPAITAALVTTTSIAWKTAQLLIVGQRSCPTPIICYVLLKNHFC
jgi:hypothetical protein